MKRVGFWCIAAPLVVTVAGCAGNLKLLEDGKQHPGRFESVTKAVEVNIDGVVYKGTFSQNMGFGVGNTFTGKTVGTTTMLMGDGSGSALLTSPEGKVLRCVFGSIVFMRGQGQCQNNDGKVYDLLVGG